MPGQQVGLWLPGDKYEPRSRRHAADSIWRDFDFGDTNEYLDAYASAREPYIAEVCATYPEAGADLGERFTEYFRRLGEISPYFLERIDMTVRFELSGAVEGRWDLDLRPEGVRIDLTGRARGPPVRLPAGLALARRHDLRPDRLGGPVPVATGIRMATPGD